MYYFDNKFLQQYIDAGANLQIYYDSEWYGITDKIDLHDPIYAVGYDEYGEPKTQVPYKQIELIQVNGSVITLEQLQSMMTGKPKEDEDPDSKKSSSPPSEESEIEEPKEPKPKEKGPDLSWHSPHYNLGRLILKESRKKK